MSATETALTPFLSLMLFTKITCLSRPAPEDQPTGCHTKRAETRCQRRPPSLTGFIRFGVTAAGSNPPACDDIRQRDGAVDGGCHGVGGAGKDHLGPGGIGAAMKPMQFLKAGDVVRIEIERLGAIENPCAPEPDRG